MIDEDNVNEEIRLKYRYIDLRRDMMQKNLRMRHRIAMAVRTYLDKQGFIDIETPFLYKSTPEGARIPLCLRGFTTATSTRCRRARSCSSRS